MPLELQNRVEHILSGVYREDVTTLMMFRKAYNEACRMGYLRLTYDEASFLIYLYQKLDQGLVEKWWREKKSNREAFRRYFVL